MSSSKQDFYTGLAGGSMSEIHALILVPLSAILFSGNDFIRCWLAFILSVTILPSYAIALFLVAGALKWYTLDVNKSIQTPFPSITIFKSLMMIMTIICILAVDFPIFNRRLAKTEIYGTSLMDIGVGTFIYSGGLMFGLRNLNSINAVFLKAIPVWLLGLGRLISVKMSDYHEHVTEYGIHWNFFFTLGTIPILATIWSKIPISNLYLGYSIGILYQSALHFGGMDYILYADRSNLISMNREGILSCLGYLSLWLMAADVGANIKQPHFTNYLFKRIAVNFGFICILMSLNIQISRRATNFVFVLWCTFVSDVFLWLLHYKVVVVPKLLVLINKHQLVLFLIANVITGCINMVLDTQNTSDIAALLILINYALVMTVTAQIL